MSKTGKTIAKAIPIAGAILAYKAARDMGWSESDAAGYAMVSVFNGDIAIDAALFAEEKFWIAAEGYKGELNEAYLDDLNEAIVATEHINGHEEGISDFEERLDHFLAPGTRAGDVGGIVGSRK